MIKTADAFYIRFWTLSKLFNLPFIDSKAICSLWSGWDWRSEWQSALGCLSALRGAQFVSPRFRAPVSSRNLILQKTSFILVLLAQFPGDFSMHIGASLKYPCNSYLEGQFEALRMPQERLGYSSASFGTALPSRCISNEWAVALYGNSERGEEWEGETTAPQPCWGGGSMLELGKQFTSKHDLPTFCLTGYIKERCRTYDDLHK